MRIVKEIEITKDELDRLNKGGLIEITNYHIVHRIKVINYNEVEK